LKRGEAMKRRRNEKAKMEVDKLVQENQGLVYHVAHKSFGSRLGDEDMIQCGFIGLWNAARVWDEERPFSSFACICIKNAMLDYLRGESNRVFTIDIEEQNDIPDEKQEPKDGMVNLFPYGTIEREVAELLSKGYTKKETADILKKSAKTVYRACARIKEEIENQT
jgi:RNA polymerase sigma factor (sigma-70 family)